MGRTLVGAPKMPDDRVEYLRAVFKKVLTDPAVMDEGAKTQRWLSWADGRETQKFVRDYLAKRDPKMRAKVKQVILEKF
jgi:tripartite-type tricarboxylate transporter receptor subunit TctC